MIEACWPVDVIAVDLKVFQQQGRAVSTELILRAIHRQFGAHDLLHKLGLCTDTIVIGERKYPFEKSRAIPGVAFPEVRFDVGQVFEFVDTGEFSRRTHYVI